MSAASLRSGLFAAGHADRGQLGGHDGRHGRLRLPQRHALCGDLALSPHVERHDGHARLRLRLQFGLHPECERVVGRRSSSHHRHIPDGARSGLAALHAEPAKLHDRLRVGDVQRAGLRFALLARRPGEELGRAFADDRRLRLLPVGAAGAGHGLWLRPLPRHRPRRAIPVYQRPACADLAAHAHHRDAKSPGDLCAGDRGAIHHRQQHPQHLRPAARHRQRLI